MEARQLLLDKYGIWFDAARTVHQRLERINQVFSIAFDVMICGGIAYEMYRHGYGLHWITLAVLGAIGALRLISYIRDRIADSRGGQGGTEEYQDKLARQSGDAQVLDRMLSGEITGNEMVPWTPWHFRWLLPVRPDPTPLQVVERVAFSLEWYTGPPRTHIRRYWYAMAFPLIILPMFLAPWLLGAIYLNDMTFYFPLFMFLTFVPHLFIEAHTACAMIAVELEARAEAILENSEAVMTGAPAGSAEPHPEPRRDPLGILPIINQLEQDLDFGRLGMALPYTGLLMWSGFLLIILTVFVEALTMGGNFIWAMLFSLIMTITGVTVVTFLPGIAKQEKLFGRYRDEFRARLRQSDLAVQLALNQDDVLPAGLDPPGIFRPLLHLPRIPAGYAGSIRRKLWRVAFNLDWLLDPGQLQIRPCWLALPAQVLGILGMSFAGFIARPLSVQGLDAGVLYLSISTVSATVFLAASVPGVLYMIHAQIWSTLLLEHLRDRFADDEA